VLSTQAQETPPLVAFSVSPQILAQVETTSLLQFETEHYMVRVFRQDDQTYLNVYNKETGLTDVNQVPAIRAPLDSDDDTWLTYMNQYGDLEYRAKVDPEGHTELEIRLPGAPPTQGETGFNVIYSFPHVYLGADIETTLSELQASGWSVDINDGDFVELTRNQRALDLRFDPVTQSITYTRLIDLT
jgi:hypothetical protein